MYTDMKIFNDTVELVKAALSAQQEAASSPITHPSAVATLIQTIYTKLSEINKTLKD